MPEDVNRAGFGHVNIANALAVVHGEAGTSFDEPSLDDKTLRWEKTITVNQEKATLKVTLVCSDPPGDMIKIKLRLEVKDAHGPKFTPSNNVVQQVVIEKVTTGAVTLEVRVIGKALAKSPQKFAISWRVY